MIQVTITSAAVRRQTGVSKSSGKAYDMAFQTVWMHTFARDGTKNPYPEKVEVILDKDPDGTAIYYPPGEYQLHPSSFYVDQRGNVAVAPRLVALKPKAVAA